MKIAIFEFTRRNTREHLGYIDENRKCRYNYVVKKCSGDGGTRHAVPVFGEEL